MLTKIDIEDALELLFTKNTKYFLQRNTYIHYTKCNEVLVNFILKISTTIDTNQKNHETMKRISKIKNKTITENNVLRWWDEMFSFPNWVKSTNLTTYDILESHTKIVTKQAILLLNYLENSR
jgi:hypothetical protein